MNTHWGAGHDGMSCYKDSIVAFDASFPLRFADHAVADQSSTGRSQVRDAQGPVRRARGRYHGLWRHPACAGDPGVRPLRPTPWSAWGDYLSRRELLQKLGLGSVGRNNTDIFARGNDEMAGVFTNVIGRLVDRVYLTQPHTDWPCYRYTKSPIELGVTAINSGASNHQAHVKLEVVGESGNVAYAAEKDTVLQAGGSAADIAWTLKPEKPLAGGFLPNGYDDGGRWQSL